MASAAAAHTVADILTEDALHNAMVTHAAFGGSTNLLLHIPAIAHAAGCRAQPSTTGQRINRQVPRLVDVLPNGPTGYGTVRSSSPAACPK